ncbi:MAG TPA: hypothetical protein VF610_06135 [Segetibacter sp.]
MFLDVLPEIAGIKPPQSGQKVQECDATMFHPCTIVWIKKKKHFIFWFYINIKDKKISNFLL